MKSQLDQQRKAVDQLISNTKWGPIPWTWQPYACTARSVQCLTA